jgi:hypothetical protein
MNARGWVGVHLDSFLTSVPTGSPATLDTEKTPPISTEWWLGGGTAAGLDAHDKNQFTIPWRPGRRPVTMPTELSRLQILSTPKIGPKLLAWTKYRAAEK